MDFPKRRGLLTQINLFSVLYTSFVLEIRSLLSIYMAEKFIIADFLENE